MNRSRSSSAALVLLALTTCGSEPEFESIDVGVDVRLNAVAENWSHFVAVGADGVIVDDDGQSWDVGAMELRDVAFFEERDAWRWFVVGDQGLALHASHREQKDFSSEPKPIEWVTVDVGTTADLHATQFWDGYWVVVAGDETLRVSFGWDGPDYDSDDVIWTDPTPPPEGWGRLRALFVGPGPRLWAAGEQGRLLWAEGDLQQWFVENLNTTSTLRDGGEFSGRAWVVGDEGTISFARPNESWIPETLHTQHDLLGFGFAVIGSDQTLRDLHLRKGTLYSEVLARFDWQPRAISEHYVVGDDGNVVYYCNCPPE